MHPRFTRSLLLLGLPLALAACSPPATPPTAKQEQRADSPSKPLVALPPAPELTAAGHDLIYEFETGGEREYNRNPHPEYPGGPSGVTWGIGYDATAQSEAVIRLDWEALGSGSANRLAATHPFRGQNAKAHLPDVRDVLVVWSSASAVFDTVDLARTTALCRRTFHGFEQLKPNAQAAIISLVFNRGAALVGPSRTEMERIAHEDAPNGDYQAMARDFRAMKRVWRGTDIEAGMTRRREAEAKLVETCL